MNNTDLLDQAADIEAGDYCPFGIATCFIRNEGEIHQVKIIEPIPSAALEAVLQGVPTSYEAIHGKTFGEIVTEEELKIDEQFPQEAQFCDRFIERAIAATRTYKNRPEAKNHIAVGTVKTNLNYDLSKKRVLNQSTSVSVEDNVKQHEYTHKVL